MKSEAIKQQGKIFDIAKNYSMKILFAKAMYFISGTLISRGIIFGGYYPFGISLSASSPGKMIIPTILGIILGYLFPLRFSMGIRYISAVISIAAIRWTLNDLVKIKNHILYTPLIVFFSSFITGLAINSADGFDGREISISLLESLLAAGAAYFFDNTFKIFSRKKIYSLNSREFTCIAVSASITLLSLSEIFIGSISLGRVLATVMILISSCTLGVIGGGISGIASGVIFSLPSFGFTYISGAYAFGGMIAGFCSSWGKLSVCASFIFINTFISFQCGDITRMVNGFYESVIGIIIFLIIPNSILNKIKELPPSIDEFSKYEKSIKEATTQKLKFASKSLNLIPFFIDKASEGFSKIQETDFKNICMSSLYQSCASCGLCSLCWSKESESTHKNFSHMITTISENRIITSRDFSLDFIHRCNKIDMLIKKASKSYTDFCIQKTAKAKLDEFKKIMSEQFCGISSLIENLSTQILKDTILDKPLACKISSALLSAEIKTKSVLCYKNESKKLFVEIECDDTIKNKFTPTIINRISQICGRKFSTPILNKFKEISRIRLCENKDFNIDFGFYQHAFNNGKYCGDSCCKFEDGIGNFNVIISDGMGTGGEAAAQGAMTSRLMKSFIECGIGFEPSIKFVNSALLLKPGEECLSTIDALSIDLFTGKAEFVKAGSPVTFIVRNKELIKIHFESLPIGILSNVSFYHETIELQNHDWIIMLSDGATDIGEEWIAEIIKKEVYNTASQLSKLIVDKAVSLRKESNDDDITAIVLNLLKNT